MPDSNLEILKKKIEALPGNDETPTEPPATEDSAMGNETEGKEVKEPPVEKKPSELKKEGIALGKSCKAAYKTFEQSVKSDPKKALQDLIEDLKNLQEPDSEETLPGAEAPLNTYPLGM